MTIVYLPTWMVDFYGFHVDIQYMDPMGIYIYIHNTSFRGMDLQKYQYLLDLLPNQAASHKIKF